MLQRDIPRRAREDNRQPPSSWGVDRTEADDEDFYPEEDLPKASVPRRGKDYIKHFFPQWSDADTDSDECTILIPIVASPIRCFPGPVPAAPRRTAPKPAPPATSSSTAASRGSSRGRGKKRGVAKCDLAPEAKRPKVASGRPKPKGQRPTFKG